MNYISFNKLAFKFMELSDRIGELPECAEKSDLLIEAYEIETTILNAYGKHFLPRTVWVTGDTVPYKFYKFYLEDGELRFTLLKNK